MLDIVISLLPTKSVVRTTVLSRWWVHLWRFAPLNLTVDQALSVREHKRVATVSKILATHPRPARCLSISLFSPKCKIDTKFDKWFRTSTLDCLEDLTFNGGTAEPRSLPRSALRFAPTMRIVHLWSCCIPEIDVAPMLLFPRLKQLHLYNVFILEVAIQRLLASCTTLECLHIQGIHGFKTLCIVSPNLHTIGVADMWRHNCLMEFQELVIQTAPCLERLIVLGPMGPRSIRVVGAAKLTVFGYVPKESCQLLNGAIPAQRMIPTSLTPSVRRMKVLVLNSITHNLDAVVGFLIRFHSKEKLYIESEIDMDMKNVLEYNTFYPMNALFHLGQRSTCSTSHEANL